jgi:hypothetical protein
MDAIAGVPMVIILIVFKIWLSHTVESRFRHYRPTPDEAEEQHLAAMKQKRTQHSDMERKFLNPALRPDRVFTVMVHKKQEDLARQILSSYPWFAEKGDGLLRGVREENLEYNPDAERATDAGDWDARSRNSMDLLSNFGDDRSIYNASPIPAHATVPTGSKSSLAYGHTFNHSTDELLASPAPVGYSRALASSDPLLPGGQWDGRNSPSPSIGPVPYPPSAYPDGYGMSGMYRTVSDLSNGSRPYDAGYGAGGYGAGGYGSAPDLPPPQAYHNTYPPEAPHRVASPAAYGSPAGYGSPHNTHTPSPMSPPSMNYGYDSDGSYFQPHGHGNGAAPGGRSR